MPQLDFLSSSASLGTFLTGFILFSFCSMVYFNFSYNYQTWLRNRVKFLIQWDLKKNQALLVRICLILLSFKINKK